MTVVEDLKNELYTLDSSQWSVNLECILKLLSFPVRISYSCNNEEFLYEYSGKLNSMSGKDRKILSECLEIAEYRMEKKFRRIRLFGVRISGNDKTKNEKVYDIYKVFVRLYGRFTMLAVIFDGKVSFAGLNMTQEKHAEVVLSEWFGYYDEYEKLSKLIEIDFSTFSNRYLGRVYQEYVRAISREYIKYSESKMYLIYGCSHPITYEFYKETERSNEEVLITAVDREKTLEKNSLYFPNLYGWDYFMDDKNLEIEIDDYIIDEEEAEFEWTMLEMELAAEESEDDYGDGADYFGDHGVEDDYDEEFIGLNPEEMLEFIRSR